MTTHVAPGTTISYTLTGISEQDLASGSLTGVLTVDSNGKAGVTVALANDHKTEGAETMVMTLSGGQTASVVVNDTSVTQGLVLTTGTDLLNGDGADNFFLASGQTLQTADVLNGQGGDDTLVVMVDNSTVAGGYNVDAAPHLAGIETIRVNAPNVVNPEISIDLSNATGVTALESYQVSDYNNQGGFVEFLDIQSVSDTSIKIVDTNIDHEFSYDNVNAYRAGALNDVVTLTVQEVDGSALTFSNERPHQEGASNVEQVNLTSLQRVQNSNTTFNDLSALNVGGDFQQLVIDGAANLRVGEDLDRNIRTIDARDLGANLTLSVNHNGTGNHDAEGNGADLLAASDATIAQTFVYQGAEGVDTFTLVRDSRNLNTVNQIIARSNIELNNGADILSVAGAGLLTVTGGIGNDSVTLVGDGEHNIDLGADNDTLNIAGNVTDFAATVDITTIVAGTGNDTVAIVGTGDYDINLGTGADRLTKTGAGNHTVVAGDGNDTVTITGAGNNNVNLGIDNDTLVITGAGNNSVQGGDGNDSITITGNGNQTVDGGLGNDTIAITGNGNDVIVAGLGNDSVSITGFGVHNVNLGEGDDNLLIDGARTANGNLDNTIADAMTTVVGGAGNDTVDVRADHFLNADLGAGSDLLILRAQDLTTDDMIIGGNGAGEVDTLRLTNLSTERVVVGESETDSTVGIETFDLRQANITLELTNENFNTAENKDITVNTQGANGLAIPQVSANPALQLFQGMTVQQFAAVAAATVYGNVDNLVDFLITSGVSGIDFNDATGDNDSRVYTTTVGNVNPLDPVGQVTATPGAHNQNDRVFFTLVQPGDMTVDLTDVNLSLASERNFTLEGGTIRDIVVADDATINGRSTLHFDGPSANGNTQSAVDTLRVIDGATITTADLRNVDGLEIIELRTGSNQPARWDIELNDRVINQTTGSATLQINVGDEVPAGSSLFITLDPSVTAALNDVVINRNSNVQVFINNVLVTEDNFSLDLNPGGYQLQVISALEFTTSTDNLIGSNTAADLFTARTLDQVQAADFADGRGGVDTARFNFAVANGAQSLNQQFNGATIQNIENFVFETENVVRMNGLGYTIAQLTTGNSSDVLTNMTKGLTYNLRDGNDSITLANDTVTAVTTIDGGVGTDSVIGGTGEDNVAIQNVEFVDLGNPLGTSVGANGDRVTLLQANPVLVTIRNAETVTGSSGNDLVNADNNGGYIAVDGGLGDDTLTVGTATPTDATVIGNLGADVINVRSTGTAVVWGDLNLGSTVVGQGADSITVRAVTGSTVYAGQGNDTVSVLLEGNGAANVSASVFGENGDDQITLTTPTGLPGQPYVGMALDVALTVDGGIGADTISVSAWGNNSTALTVNGGDGNDSVFVDQNIGTFPGSMTATVSGGNGDDTIAYHTEMSGIATNAVGISGDAGNDVISVTFDNSPNVFPVTAPAFDPTVSGGTGNDTITLTNTQPGTITATASVNGNEGNDVINVATDGWITTITGAEGNDTINLRADTVTSNFGNVDTLVFGNINYAAGQTVQTQNTQGLDNITGFVFETTGGDPAPANQDLIDLTAFLGATTTVPNIVTNLGTWSHGVTVDANNAAGNSLVVLSSNGLSLTANDFSADDAGGLNAIAGTIQLNDNGRAVVVVGQDQTGPGSGIHNFDIYFVQDIDSGAGQTWQVDKVADIEAATLVGVLSVADNFFVAPAPVLP